MERGELGVWTDERSTLHSGAPLAGEAKQCLLSPSRQLGLEMGTSHLGTSRETKRNSYFNVKD